MLRHQLHNQVSAFGGTSGFITNRIITNYEYSAKSTQFYFICVLLFMKNLKIVLIFSLIFLCFFFASIYIRKSVIEPHIFQFMKVNNNLNNKVQNEDYIWVSKIWRELKKHDIITFRDNDEKVQIREIESIEDTAVFYYMSQFWFEKNSQKIWNIEKNRVDWKQVLVLSGYVVYSIHSILSIILPIFFSWLLIRKYK